MEEEHEMEMSPKLIILSAIMFVVGLVADGLDASLFNNEIIRLAWYAITFIPVGAPVIICGAKEVMEGEFTSEHILMGIAAIGAFAIGEYPEAVAVMMLYCIGEYFQDKAVDRARDNIKSLAALRPDKAMLVSGDKTIEKRPEEINVGDTIEVKAGERVPLDGNLLSADASFNTAALTGESMPRVIEKSGEVLAGMISTDSTIRIKVSRTAGDSAISRILKMVESASERKAPTELFVSKFAHVYTPTVVILAAMVVLIPWLLSLFMANADCSESYLVSILTSIMPHGYVFSEWLHRALVFLVISCPCALVISIPLGYFAGIGAASRHGILFKGGNYIDAIANVDTVVFDKTGTLSTGEFAVVKTEGLSEEDINMVVSIERTSNHPIAKALIKSLASDDNKEVATDVKDIAGYGLQKGEWLVGTTRLLDKRGIAYPESLNAVENTTVVVARSGKYIGMISLADTLKEDAKTAIANINANTEILSGDRQSTVDYIAREIGVSCGYGDLLPQDKVSHIEKLKAEGRKVAFVGDGINDAPVLALSDVGIAMGAMGSDMAIETADIVIETDQPSKVAKAIEIAKRTRTIVVQNIAFAIGVKLLVMVLGIFDIASLWAAVFADTGVTLLAVLNSMRILIKK